MELLGISQTLSNFIIRPSRMKYSLSDLYDCAFTFNHKVYERVDFQVPVYQINLINRGKPKKYMLHASLFSDKFLIDPRPTVVCLHANSACRLSAKNYFKNLIADFDVLTFDFRGCGMSEGPYITLGYVEKEDLKAVLDHVDSHFGKRQYILWGRSMGAVTAILFAAKYRRVQALVVDSPFSDLHKVIQAIAAQHLPVLPDFLVESIIDSIQAHINQKIMQEYGYDYCLKKLKPIEAIKHVKAPIYFIGSKNDQLVDVQQLRDLHSAFRGFKEIQIFQGDHNSIRPAHLKLNVVQFLKAAMKMKVACTFQRKRIFSPQEHNDKNCLHRQDQSQCLNIEHQQKIEEVSQENGFEYMGADELESFQTFICKQKLHIKTVSMPAKRRRIFSKQS